MRFISFYMVLALFSGLSAGEPSRPPSAAANAGWVLLGTDQAISPDATEVTLPASAQLARIIDQNTAEIRLRTQPVIAPDFTDWPILELGTAALVLTRNQSAGGLLLVLEGKDPVAVPLAFSFDASGKATKELEIGLTLTESSVKVVLNRSSWQFPLTEIPRGGLELVATAGTKTSWLISDLQVEAGLKSLAIASPPSAPANSSPAASIAVTAETLRSQFRAKFESDALARRSAAVAAPGGQKGANAISTLEIYTPPSIRHGRAEAIRSTVLPTKTN